MSERNSWSPLELPEALDPDTSVASEVGVVVLATAIDKDSGLFVGLVDGAYRATGPLTRSAHIGNDQIPSMHVPQTTRGEDLFFSAVAFTRELLPSEARYRLERPIATLYNPIYEERRTVSLNESFHTVYFPATIELYSGEIEQGIEELIFFSVPDTVHTISSAEVEDDGGSVVVSPTDEVAILLARQWYRDRSGRYL